MGILFADVASPLRRVVREIPLRCTEICFTWTDLHASTLSNPSRWPNTGRIAELSLWVWVIVSTTAFGGLVVSFAARPLYSVAWSRDCLLQLDIPNAEVAEACSTTVFVGVVVIFDMDHAAVSCWPSKA